jgi:hypothetical protein
MLCAWIPTWRFLFDTPGGCRTLFAKYHAGHKKIQYIDVFCPFVLFHTGAVQVDPRLTPGFHSRPGAERLLSTSPCTARPTTHSTTSKRARFTPPRTQHDSHEFTPLHAKSTQRRDSSHRRWPNLIGFCVDVNRNVDIAVPIAAHTHAQGLTLVHVSAQSEPFLTQSTPRTPPSTP